MRGLLSCKPPQGPLSALREKIILEALETEKYQEYWKTHFLAISSTFPLAEDGGTRTYEKYSASYQDVLFQWNMWQSIARRVALKEGRQYLSSEQQEAVERFLEMEKTGKVNG